jgi:hypothetical protein
MMTSSLQLDPGRTLSLRPAVPSLEHAPDTLTLMLEFRFSG